MIQEIRAIKIKVAVKHSKNAQNKCPRRLSSTPCLNNRVFSRKRSALPRSLALFLSILSNRSVRLAASITARWIEFSASRNSLCVASSWFSSSSSSSSISVVFAVVFSRSSLFFSEAEGIFCAYFFFPFLILHVFYIGAIALVYYIYIISFGGKFCALFVLFVDICFDEMRERWWDVLKIFDSQNKFCAAHAQWHRCEH